jgi:hypothetical protein
VFALSGTGAATFVATAAVHTISSTGGAASFAVTSSIQAGIIARQSGAASFRVGATCVEGVVEVTWPLGGRGSFTLAAGGVTANVTEFVATLRGGGSFAVNASAHLYYWADLAGRGSFTVSASGGQFWIISYHDLDLGPGRTIRIVRQRLSWKAADHAEVVSVGGPRAGARVGTTRSTTMTGRTR